MLLRVASPSQLLSACPLTQILTLISLSSPVPLSFLFSQLPRLLLCGIAYRESPYALVPVSQSLLSVSVAQAPSLPCAVDTQIPCAVDTQMPFFASQHPKLP